MTIFTMIESDYNQRARDIKQAEQQTLSERKEAQAAYAALLLDARALELAAYTIIDGHGPYYAHYMIQTATRRMNRVALLGQLIALWECNCPQRHAMAAWKSLTPEQQKTCDGVLSDAIEDMDDENKNALQTHNK